MTQQDWQQRLAALRQGMADEPAEAPEPATEPESAPQKGRLDIVFEKKGRAGKSATIICGFDCDEAEVAGLASRLKKHLGCGGSCRGGEILVQGDRRADVLAYLLKNGYKARVI